MKKIALPILFCCLVSLSFGQTLKKASSYFDKKDYEKAKTEIDGFLVKKPDDAEANYWKSKIYERIADSAGIASLIQGDGRQLALDAFKKAVADSADMKAKLLIMRDNYSPVFNLYAGYYAQAAESFNTAASSQSKPAFTEAMNYFMKANDVGQYIGQNGWANIGKVDTTLVLNIGKAALNAGDEEQAKKSFTALAEAGISGMAGSDDNDSYRIPYQWLTLHYKQKGDEANMKKYADLGKKYFPTDDYFDFVMMDYYRDKKDMVKIFERYADLLKRNPDSLHYHFNYANEIFGYLYNSDEGVVIENKEDMLKTLKSELDEAYRIDPNDVNTNWLYSQYFYNQGIELRDQALKIRGSKPEDVKKKEELSGEAKKNFNEAIPYASKAIKTLETSAKKADKSRYKSITNLMQNIYQSLNDKENLKVYQDLYDKADAKFIDD